MEMALVDMLNERRSQIVQKWIDAILATYPVDKSGFLKNKKDQFENPVGYTIRTNIEKVFMELLQDSEAADLHSSLTDIIKVRAVQEFTPSQSVSFIFLLKKIIREELGKAIQDRQVSEELTAFDDRIDKLALSSFDIYSECREKINDIKIMELRNMTYRLLKSANLVYDLPDEKNDGQDLKVIQREKRL